MTRLIVIGGGAAGMSAASAARRIAPGLDVVVCEAGGFAAYGMCGIPYFLGGTVKHAESLLAYPPEEFRDKRGIDLRLFTRVTGIDPAARQVHVSHEGGTETLDYDALIAASGADPVRPPVPGLGHDRVFTVRSLDEAIRLRRLLDTGTIRRRHRGRRRVHRPGDRGGAGLHRRRRGSHRGAATGARHRGRTGRRPRRGRGSAVMSGCGSVPGSKPCSAAVRADRDGGRHCS